MSRPCVWMHDGAISPEDVALRTHPDAAVIFVFDEPSLKEEPVAFHRLSFMFDGVREAFAAIPHEVKEVRLGDPAAEILDFIREHKCDQLAVTDHSSPAVRGVIEAVKSKRMPTKIYPRPQLATYFDEPKRFSRYWNRVAKEVLGYAPKGGGRRHHRK